MKKSKFLVGTTFATVLVFAASTPSFAAQDKAAAGASVADTATGELSTYDRQFVEDVASGGILEVEVGKLAAERGQSADVKAFANQMVADHSKANEQLKSIAASKGIEIPKQLNPEHKAKLDQLSKLLGAEFDRQYMDQMVKDHELTVTKFEHEVRIGSDKDIKQFAESTLPTLRTHLAHAQKVGKETDAAVEAEEQRRQGS